MLCVLCLYSVHVLNAGLQTKLLDTLDGSMNILSRED